MLQNLIDMEADGVQLGVRAVLPQANPDVSTRRRRRRRHRVTPGAAERQQEAGVLPVGGEVPAAPGAAARYPGAPEVTALPLAVRHRGQWRAARAFHGTAEDGVDVCCSPV